MNLVEQFVRVLNRSGENHCGDVNEFSKSRAVGVEAIDDNPSVHSLQSSEVFAASNSPWRRRLLVV